MEVGDDENGPILECGNRDHIGESPRTLYVTNTNPTGPGSLFQSSLGLPPPRTVRVPIRFFSIFPAQGLFRLV